MTSPVLQCARKLTVQPDKPPQSFDVRVGSTPGLIGRSTTEGTLVRIILICQPAGEWMGLEYEGFAATQLQQTWKDLSGNPSFLRFANAQDLLQEALLELRSLGLIDLDHKSEPGKTIIIPLQALVDFPALQTYRRR